MGHTGKFRFLLPAATLLAAATLAGPISAQAPDPDDAQRGVARLSLINGDVSVRRGDSGEWVAGAINAPLLADDHVATGPNSRIELEFDNNNILRAGANAQIHLAQLEFNRYQTELGKGVVTFRMLRPSDANVEIDTPSVSVRPTRAGSYRLSVNDAGETEITARGGDVEVFTPRGSQWIRSGQTMLARGPANDPEFQIVAAGGTDDWDRWSDSRDHTMMQSASSRYVPPGVYGTEDLDNYGNWVSTPDYGYVWQPTVAPEWAPYSAGRWVWGDWYGWTWVSYDPWGWAPYHYGRWFHHDRFGWCWYPGAIGVRHYWSPALVAWFGFGGGGGFGFGFGHVGWVPLAPYEMFHPWWGRGFYGRTFTTVNVTNVNVVNVYRNARFTNAVSAVGVHDFQAGRFTNIARFNGSQIGTAGAVRGAMPFTPAAQNLRFTDRAATVAPRTTNTGFFHQQQPGNVQRMPVGRTFGTGGAAGPQNNSPRGADSSGFRRFGTPAGQAGSPQVNPQQRNVERNGFGATGQSPAMRNDRPQNAQGGWNRFGSPSGSAAQSQRQDFRQNAQPSNRQQQFSAPANRPESLRVSPPVVRERPQQQSQAPQRTYSPPARPAAPSYNAPSRPSAPSYSAPRGNSGGGGNSHPSGGGNSGGHSSSSGHGGRR